MADQQSENFYATVEAELAKRLIPIRVTIAGCKTVGCMTVGNSRGLIVPSNITDEELSHLRNSLPENIVIQRVEERLSALGNVISCNDSVALVHPDVDRETMEIIEDVLKVDAFPKCIGKEVLVGQYCVLNNHGALVKSGDTTKAEIDELADLLSLNVSAATINRGKDQLAAGICLNDYAAIIGIHSTSHEMNHIVKVCNLKTDEVY